MTRLSALFLILIFGSMSSASAAIPGSNKAALQSAPAAPASGAETVGPRDRVKETVQQEFDFEGDVIETEYLRPNSAMVETVKKRSSLSLVRIKTSFLEKILSTVDEL